MKYLLLGLLQFLVFNSLANAESLRLECEEGWFDVEIETDQQSVAYVDGVGEVKFSTTKASNGSDVVLWKSDFNEGKINLFSGLAEVTVDNFSGALVGENFQCVVEPKSTEETSAFLQRKKAFLKQSVDKKSKSTEISKSVKTLAHELGTNQFCATEIFSKESPIDEFEILVVEGTYYGEKSLVEWFQTKSEPAFIAVANWVGVDGKTKFGDLIRENHDLMAYYLDGKEALRDEWIQRNNDILYDCARSAVYLEGFLIGDRKFQFVPTSMEVLAKEIGMGLFCAEEIYSKEKYQKHMAEVVFFGELQEAIDELRGFSFDEPVVEWFQLKSASAFAKVVQWTSIDEKTKFGKFLQGNDDLMRHYLDGAEVAEKQWSNGEKDNSGWIHYTCAKTATFLEGFLTAIK